MGIVQTLLATLVTLGLLVTIHEWGHFWVARRCGVKVLRFSVGFGKPLWLRKGRDGTEYAVAVIPLGGYVRMLDEREGDVPADLRAQAFNNKPVLQRMAIVAAGPVVNLLFAVLAYWFLFVWGVTSVVPVVGGVEAGSLADKSGLPGGVELLEVDGHSVQSWDEVNLRLAARVGESGVLQLLAGEPQRGLAQSYQVKLDRWSVDLEKESPISALGIQPYRPEVPAVIGTLSEGGAAQAAGLMAGDKVLSINGHPVSGWMALVEEIRQSPGQTLSLGVQRGAQRLELEVVPAERVDDAGDRYGFIGAGVQAVEWPPEMLRELRYGPLDAVWIGLRKTGQMIGLTLDSIGKMIAGAISVKNLSGPITIAKVAGASAASGLESFVSFLAYLSISLGVLNLLPIPMLDGGHLLYQFIELVRGRPVSEKVQMLGLRLGMAMLLSLMALAMLNDIARL
ncbi:Membrane-associated zinc metalloprotease [Marinobacterium lacunae]|uniref:Zinc metalloprotease n=1 Tax=Marinobacterium lacunae TaxID=1232683 RepID=A0A081G0R6_9GAMM|nr:sigma E protease regulator RseP [Marinobacterium lacunae]KEA64371.1 Membrane-associated zinc metalloprotease [Marinobacterium lacunae]MBR9884523.1 sigma E protease regulator RseP [Oceanospirillales bacterium]